MSMTYDKFVLLNELPLHLCNINLILIPIAILTNNRVLNSFIYFIGTVGAVSGVLFFDSYFLGQGGFTFVVQIFFIYHSILFSLSLLPVLLKRYTPRMTDIFISLAMLFGIGILLHHVNALFRWAGWYGEANYFYTYGMPENLVLGPLKRAINVNLWYMIPLVPVIVGFNFLMWLPFKKHKASNKGAVIKKPTDNAGKVEVSDRNSDKKDKITEETKTKKVKKSVQKK